MLIMDSIEECINEWVNHFRNLGADIGDIRLNYMGWKWAITIWDAGPYHKIAQAMGVRELKVNYDGELFFRTERVPEGDPKLEWSIRLLQSSIPTFRKKYGQYYDISPL